MSTPTLTITIPSDMLESLIHAVQLEVSYTYTQARERRTNDELPAIFARRQKLWELQDDLRTMRLNAANSEPTGELSNEM